MQKLSKPSAEEAPAALRWLHTLGRVTAKDIEKASATATGSFRRSRSGSNNSAAKVSDSCEAPRR